MAQKALPYLAEQGYVLVSADMLESALRQHDEEWGRELHRCRHGVAILAALPSNVSEP